MQLRNKNLVVAAFLIATALSHASSECAAQQAASVLPKAVENIVKNLPADTDIGIIVLDRRGKVIFQHNAESEFPAASSIKAPLLLELFAKYADELDETDRDDIAAIVTDHENPAISHFSKKSRTLIADELAGVSIKQLGKILVDSNDQSGKKYANVVYNAASNIAIALLGAMYRSGHRAKKRCVLRKFAWQESQCNASNVGFHTETTKVFAENLNCRFRILLNGSECRYHFRC